MEIVNEIGVAQQDEVRLGAQLRGGATQDLADPLERLAAKCPRYLYEDDGTGFAPQLPVVLWIQDTRRRRD